MWFWGGGQLVEGAELNQSIKTRSTCLGSHTWLDYSETCFFQLQNWRHCFCSLSLNSIPHPFLQLDIWNSTSTHRPRSNFSLGPPPQLWLPNGDQTGPPYLPGRTSTLGLCTAASVSSQCGNPPSSLSLTDSRFPRSLCLQNSATTHLSFAWKLTLYPTPHTVFRKARVNHKADVLF